MLGAMNLTDQAVIRTLGSECEGVISPAHFVEGADNPVTVKFVKDYGAKYGKIPSLFGFSIPNFSSLFGAGDEQLNQIESTVAAAVENGYEGWTVKLADGSTWQQTDGTTIALPPRRGDKAIVKRGTLGSYYIKLGSQPGFKAKRVG